MDKILITGGCGAIGFNLASALVAKNSASVHVIDNLSSGANSVPEQVQFEYIDVSNTEQIVPYLKSLKPTHIFHLAAHFANQNSVEHPISDVNTNIIGLINVFESQKENSNLKKIVYASSSCVYGNLEHMAEDANVSPCDTPYAINKYAGELYAKYYASVCSVPTVCARIFNNFGPGEYPGKYRNVIPNFIQCALNNEDIVITGSGEETRDFNYVENTVDLLVKANYSRFKNGEVFNSGTGKTISIKVLAELIIEIAGSDSKIVYGKPRGWDHIPHRKSDIAKSRDSLEYAPIVNFREHLTKTVEWIKQESD